jgi:hypothetical protein
MRSRFVTSHLLRSYGLFLCRLGPRGLGLLNVSLDLFYALCYSTCLVFAFRLELRCCVFLVETCLLSSLGTSCLGPRCLICLLIGSFICSLLSILCSGHLARFLDDFQCRIPGSDIAMLSRFADVLLVCNIFV